MDAKWWIGALVLASLACSRAVQGGAAAPGAPVVVTPVQGGSAECAAGGVRIDAGGVISTVCNGLPGAPGAPGPVGPRGVSGGDVVSVKDFGAVGDGLADDTLAIQAAIDAAGATARVVIPKGTYRTAGQLVLGSGSHLEGYGAVLRPDRVPDIHLIRARGTQAQRLSDITVRGIRVDGANKGPDFADYDEGWGQVRFDFVDDLVVSDLSWAGVHSCLVLRGVVGFSVSRMVGRDLTDGVVTLFSGTRQGTISDIRATNASELMDFYDNSDVVVTNVQGTGQVTPAHMNEAFDISTSRRITITNAEVSGFALGARIKSEAGHEGVPAWEDITIANLRCSGQLKEGINAQASAPGYLPPARLRLSNVSIRSAAPGAAGILLAPSAAGAADARIEGADIDVPGTGIAAYGWTDLVLRGNRVRAANGLGIDVSAMPTPGVRIEGNSVVASGGGKPGAAINVLRSDDARITDNVVRSAEGTAIHFGAGAGGGARPVIARNTVSGAGYYGILVQLAAPTIDPLRAGSIVDNDVRDWGQVGTYRAGIYASLSGFSGVLEGLVISRNVLALPTAARNDQFAVVLAALSGEVQLGRAALDGNFTGSGVTYPGVSTGGSITGVLPPAGSVPAASGGDTISNDRGDASVELLARLDDPIQRFATTLTAERAVVLRADGAVRGDHFRVVRTGLGPHGLDVGGLKVIPPGTAAFVDVTFDGAAWALTGYGRL